jgi:hypothetical protein
MYIEDILIALDRVGHINRFDKSVVESLSTQILDRGDGFTEKQSHLALKIIKRYITQLNDHYRRDIAIYVDNPVFKLAIRTPASNYRKMSVISHPQWVKAIKVEFPYNEAFVQLIRENRSEGGFSLWDKEAKAWMFNLSETNIQLVKKLIEREVFDIDSELKEYMAQVNDILGNMETFMPMLCLDEKTPKYVNIPAYAPELKTTNILESVFEARKIGVDIWDDGIDQFLNSDAVAPIARNFLKTSATERFHLDSTTTSMNMLKDIVQYLEPVLFIIPGGSEFAKTKMSYEFLKEQNIKNEEISVMFRLPSGDGKNFNDFVKENNLNNPITEKTRCVFVSTKMPKPVLTSNTKFNCVVSLGLHNMHYTIRDFVKNCPNLIFYCEQRPNKELDFGNM